MSNFEASAAALWLSEYINSVSDNHKSYWESEPWLNLMMLNFWGFDFITGANAVSVIALTELMCDHMTPVIVLSLKSVAVSV